MANLADFDDELDEEAIAVLAVVEEEETDKDEISAENKNLAKGMDEHDLNKIAQHVTESYREDLDSRSSWIEKIARWRKLYFQEDSPINPPWPGASEESIPILTEAVNQFRSRATRVMFPGGNVVAAIPTANVTSDDIERAERVSKHMSWQITVQDLNYKKNMKRLASLVALDGSFFRKIYRDPRTKRNIAYNVPARFLVVPYGDGPRDIEDLNRKTEIIHISTNKTRKMAETGYLLKPAENWRRDSIEDDVKDAIDEAVGLDQPTNTDISGMSVLMEWHGFLDLKDLDGKKDGVEKPYIVVIDAETEEVLRIAQRWEEDDEEFEPIEYYEHYYFLENPDGFYGLGFGFMLEQLNSAINRMLRQSINAATLKNSAGGFVDEALGVQGGEIRFTMGQFKKVAANGRDLREGILALNQYFPGADNGIVTLMTSMIEHAKRLAMTTDALSGQVTKVMQPTTILALIEQGLQQFTAAQENIIDSWSGERRKWVRLNSVYLNEEEYFAVLDDKGLPQQEKVYREDYKQDLQVIPVADPTLATSQQRIAKGQALLQALSAGIQLGIPYNQREILEHFRRYYEAYEFSDINKLLPVPDDDEIQENDPLKENFYLLLPGGKIPKVYWGQDHAQHFKEHLDFLNDPDYGARIPIDGRKQLETHIRSHVAIMYATTEAGMESPPDNVNELLDIAAMEGTTPPQMNPEALQQLAGQNTEEAMGPDPLAQANKQQEDLGAILGG
jgi:chaperonin GroES